MEELRFGLIGLGIHGARYAHHLSVDLPGARLAAVCRRNAGAGRKLAGETGAAFFTDFRELIGSGQVDAVCAVVPPDLHPEIAAAAAAADVALLLEKPLAVDAAAARRVLAAAASSRAPLMVAHTLRYNRTVLEMKRLLTGMGPVHLVAMNQRFEPAARDWLDRPGPGGVVKNTGIHEFDLLRFLTGLEARSVRCRTRRVATRRTEDVFAAVLELEPGSALATIDASRAVGGRSARVEIATADGQLVADHSLGTLQRLGGRSAEAIPLPEAVPTVRETLRDFARAVRGEIPVPIPAVEGARAVAIADACLRSAATGAAAAVEAIETPGS